MDSKNMVEFILEFQENDQNNRISEEVAKKPEYIGKKIFDGAICGIAAADDPVILSLKDNKEAGLDMLLPEEWLPGAKSVVSFFLPFEHWITEENIGGDIPSAGWLHGRIEGQMAINKMSLALTKKVMEEGFETIVPALDPRFWCFTQAPDYVGPKYTCNWSERHVAFAAGIGTFGLSRGFISEIGTAGRLMSFITTLSLEPTPRPYEDLLEYCSKCCSCIPACPGKAISLEQLKDHVLCDEWTSKVREMFYPYYGCGKCQSGMPCAYTAPGKRQSK